MKSHLERVAFDAAFGGRKLLPFGFDVDFEGLQLRLGREERVGAAVVIIPKATTLEVNAGMNTISSRGSATYQKWLEGHLDSERFFSCIFANGEVECQCRGDHFDRRHFLLKGSARDGMFFAPL
jgi:hypothetical protein